MHDGLFLRNTLQLLVLLLFLCSLSSQQHNCFSFQVMSKFHVHFQQIKSVMAEKHGHTRKTLLLWKRPQMENISSWTVHFMQRNHFPLPAHVCFTEFRNLFHPVSGWAQEESSAWLPFHLKRDVWSCYVNSSCGRRKKQFWGEAFSFTSPCSEGMLSTRS